MFYEWINWQVNTYSDTTSLNTLSFNLWLVYIYKAIYGEKD